MLVRKQWKGHLKIIEPRVCLQEGAGMGQTGGVTLDPDEPKGKSECRHLKVAKFFGMLS